VLRQLRRNRDQIRAEGVDLRKHFLQSYQLRIAIGSPAPAVKSDDQGPLGEQCL
jgi:hypothetical protein